MSIKQITSRDNSLYKELKQLSGSAQARSRAGQTLLDGIHLCEVYIRQVGMPQLCVISDAARNHDEASMILASCETGGASCIILPEPLFKAVSQVENGIHLMFLIDIPSETPVLPLQQSAVLLDRLQDPGNLGSILRTTAAAGIKHVFCSEGCASAWAPKVIRAGMGAHFSLTILEGADLAALITESAVPSVATSSHADGILYALDLRRPIAWMFGHEGQGVRSELMILANYRILVPQVGTVESLNVAASAAVCLFEQVRQQISN